MNRIAGNKDEQEVDYVLERMKTDKNLEKLIEIDVSCRFNWTVLL